MLKRRDMMGAVDGLDAKNEDGLFALAGALAKGGSKALIDDARDFINSANPLSVMAVVDRIASEFGTVDATKLIVDRFMRVVGSSLKTHAYVPKKDEGLLDLLVRENDAARQAIQKIKIALKTLNRDKTDDTIFDESRRRVLSALEHLSGFTVHYIKKENILFPVLEQRMPNTGCLPLMWSYHDDIRQALFASLDGAKGAADNDDLKNLNSQIGKLLFLMMPIMMREEQVLFPAAAPLLSAKEWKDLASQGANFTYWGFEGPSPSPSTIITPATAKTVNLPTGALTAEQLHFILANLSCEISFVDENDKVLFYSDSPDRIFPRSEAIIGRKVQNCHPPDSVDTVNEILASFKDGQKDEAEFWFEHGGRFLHITYRAIRNDQGTYLGCLESTTDATGLRSLAGERRLLNWDDAARHTSEGEKK